MTDERSAIGLRSERGPVLAGVMLATSLVAIDSTILATAVPSLVGELGGFAQFPWLFSVYLLAQAVSVPIYGKVADLVGRKPMMLIGIAIFLVASVLCGAAWNMTALIVFRALQGLGAGAVLPMGQTILGDIYSVAERARVTGYLASVWAVSAVVGPTLGGLFADYLSWRWIFFVNIPLALAALAVLQRYFGETITRGRPNVDYAGAVLLAVGASLLILGLLQGGVGWAWTSPTGLTVLITAVVLLIAFGVVETRAAEPILPGWVFRRRILVGANAVALGVGVLLIGITAYVPVYAQQVLGTSALVAGFAVAALTIGWPVAASLSGRLYLRIGFRDTALAGSTVTLGGAGLLLLVDPASSVWLLAAACLVMGFGFGFTAASALIGAQTAADWETRGVVTGTNLFARSLGSAVGVAAFGAIANATIGADGSTDLERLPAPLIAEAVRGVYVATVVVAALALLAAVIMPRRVPAARP